MRPYLRALTLTALFASSSSIPMHSAPQTSAGAAFDAMYEAMGGRERASGLTSLFAEAVCSGPGGAFTTQVQSTPGAGVYFRQTGGDRTTEIWSTPERTWSIKPDGSIEDHPAQVRSFLRGHEFHLLLLELETRFTQFQHAGSEALDGRTAHRINMRETNGPPASLWIDEGSSLPIALELNPEGAAGPVTVWFDDWADFAGLRLFRSFRLTEGEDRIFTYEYVALRPNAVLSTPLLPPFDPQQDEAQIRKILASDRQAHLETDASLIARNLADRIVEVSDGTVTTRTREEIQEFFQGSFAGATFHAWDDASPPVIRISPDGAMAWVIRRVTAEREDVRDGEAVRFSYSSAYTSTYELQDGVWRMTSVTSTFLPPPRS